MFVCGAGRFRLGDLDLGVGQVGTVATPLGNGCEEVVRYKVERAPGDTLRSAATVTSLCVGDELPVGDVRVTIARDTVIRYVERTRDGCDSVHVLTVDVLDEGDFGLERTAPSCETGFGQVAVSPAPDVTFEWADGDATSTRRRLRYGDTLAVTASRGGCASDFAIELGPAQFGPQLEALLGPDCPGDVGVIRLGRPSEGELRLFREDGRAEVIAGTDLNLRAGVYDFTWRDVGGCDSSFTLTVPTAPPPAFVIDGPTDVLLGVMPRYRIVGPPYIPTGLTWYFDGAPIDSSSYDGLSLTNWTPPGSGTLSAGYSDGKGCEVQLLQRVLVQDARDAFLPSAFSPDGDGLHDVLSLERHPGLVRLEGVTVYDRWGGRQSARPAVEPGDVVWDGQGYDAGVYVIQAVAALKDGRQVGFVTEVTLVR